MWKDIVERGRTQMTIRCMRIACLVTWATNTDSEYVISVTFPLQQWLHERASMLRYTFTACLVYLALCTTCGFLTRNHKTSPNAPRYVFAL